MLELQNKTDKRPARLVLYMRLKENEFFELESDAQTAGMSMIDLMKNTYFKGRLMPALMSADDRIVVLRNLSGMANNINQIARNLNGGIFQNVGPDIKAAKEILLQIMKLHVPSWNYSKKSNTAD